MRLVICVQLMVALLLGCATTSEEKAAQKEQAESPQAVRAEVKAERRNALADDPDARLKVKAEKRGVEDGTAAVGTPAEVEAGTGSALQRAERKDFSTEFYITAGIALVLFLYLMKLIFFSAPGPPRYSWRLRQ